VSDEPADLILVTTGDVVPVEGPALPAAPGLVRDAVGDLQQAWTAVRYLDVSGRAGDVSATLQTAVVCNGATQVDALQAATDFLRESPRAELHSIAWARLPGHAVDVWEYQATLIVSYPDREGDTTGATHHADRPAGFV
jgi:hypothetical protein